MTTLTAGGTGRLGHWIRRIAWALPFVLLGLAAWATGHVEGFNWTGSDFVFAAVMLFGAAGLYELGTRLSTRTPYRAGFGLAVVLCFLLAWFSLAVGIIGDPDNPANLVYFLVILAVFAGALIARFRAPAMAVVMTVAAVLQGVSIGLALFNNSVEGTVLSALFTALWLGAAELFRIAARKAAS